MTGVEEQSAPALKMPWTERVLALLGEWQRRGPIAREAHYAHATRLADYNIWFGVPVATLATPVATSVFTTLQADVRVELRTVAGSISALAAVLASVQTFLCFQERREKHHARSRVAPPDDPPGR